MNFENTTIDEVHSIFKAGFKCLESIKLSPYQRGKILLIRKGNVFTILLEERNNVTWNGDNFNVAFPSMDECTLSFGYDDNDKINYLQFNSNGIRFNQLDAIERMKELELL